MIPKLSADQQQAPNEGALLLDELDELFELCDGLHVMAQGRLSARIDRDQADVALIGSWMSGLWPQAASAAAGGGA